MCGGEFHPGWIAGCHLAISLPQVFNHGGSPWFTTGITSGGGAILAKVAGTMADMNKTMQTNPVNVTRIALLFIFYLPLPL
jgi:hypothetical protein